MNFVFILCLIAAVVFAVEAWITKSLVVLGVAVLAVALAVYVAKTHTLTF